MFEGSRPLKNFCDAFPDSRVAVFARVPQMSTSARRRDWQVLARAKISGASLDNFFFSVFSCFPTSSHSVARWRYIMAASSRRRTPLSASRLRPSFRSWIFFLPSEDLHLFWCSSSTLTVGNMTRQCLHCLSSNKASSWSTGGGKTLYACSSSATNTCTSAQSCSTGRIICCVNSSFLFVCASVFSQSVAQHALTLEDPEV